MTEQHPQPTTEIARELDLLAIEYADVIQQFRLAWLSGQVERGRMAVTQCASGFFGDRLTLVLNGRITLRLKLVHPLWVPFSSVERIAPSGDGRCVVIGTTRDGERVVCEGWVAVDRTGTMR